MKSFLPLLLLALSQVVLIQADYTVIAPADYASNSQIQDTLNFGGEHIIQLGVERSVLPEDEYKVSEVNQIEQNLLANGVNYRFDVSITSEEGVRVAALYAVYFRYATSAMKVVSYQYNYTFPNELKNSTGSFSWKDYDFNPENPGEHEHEHEHEHECEFPGEGEVEFPTEEVEVPTEEVEVPTEEEVEVEIPTEEENEEEGEVEIPTEEENEEEGEVPTEEEVEVEIPTEEEGEVPVEEGEIPNEEGEFPNEESGNEEGGEEWVCEEEEVELPEPENELPVDEWPNEWVEVCEEDQGEAAIVVLN